MIEKVLEEQIKVNVTVTAVSGPRAIADALHHIRSRYPNPNRSWTTKAWMVGLPKDQRYLVALTSSPQIITGYGRV